MNRFNRKKMSANPAGKRNGSSKKVLIAVGAAMTLLAAGPAVNTANPITGTITAYAADQTPNWFQDGNVWKVKDGAGNIVSNTWFCDLDGSWYLLDENGAMREGIIADNGHFYSLETSHAGHYGMMRTVDGVYDGVALTFQQEHNGFYGEILSGIDELLSTGADLTTVNGLPATSVYAKDFANNNANTNQNQNSYQYYTPQEIAAAESEIMSLSPEERMLLQQELDSMAADYDNLPPDEKEAFDIVLALLAKYS